MLVSTISDDVDEIIGEHKGNSFSLHSKFALEISKKVTKVNVEQLQKKSCCLLK